MTPSVINWAIRHRVSAQALHELQIIFGMVDVSPPNPATAGKSEEAVQATVRLEASQMGVHLFRNNVGALTDARGVPVRYGLANDSKKLNSVIKSGDLIGWRSVLITPQHVGQRLAVFVSRECKHAGWHYSGGEREEAQLAWAMLVTSAGGDASFCTGTGSF
jgi:hypothetical protein